MVTELMPFPIWNFIPPQNKFLATPLNYKTSDRHTVRVMVRVRIRDRVTIRVRVGVSVVILSR